MFFKKEKINVLESKMISTEPNFICKTHRMCLQMHAHLIWLIILTLKHRALDPKPL